MTSGGLRRRTYEEEARRTRSLVLGCIILMPRLHETVSKHAHDLAVHILTKHSFEGTSYKSHTSCISEDQKYQGKLYKEKKPKGQHQKNDSAQHDNSQALTAHNAYVEDATEADNAVAIVDAPPRAPTPPPAAHSLGYHEQAAIEDYNVFDFLEAGTPSVPRNHALVDESRMLEDSQPPVYEEAYTPAISDVMKFQLADEDETFAQTGFTYGGEPVRPSRERYDSYTTPAPKSKHSRTKSRDTDVETTNQKTDRKRKRNSPAELDMSLVRAQEERDSMMLEAPPSLHSGLTGGLNRLLARPEFPPSPEDSGEYANSPLSPMKRAKQRNSTALLRAQREWEVQQQKARKAEIKEEREREEKEKKKKEKKAKDRGRERDRKERNSTTTLVKVRPKNKREDSGKEIRRIRRRQYSSSVSPPPKDRKALKAIEYRPNDSRSASPDGNGQLIVRPSGDLVAAGDMDPRADLFMSFITKGPDSERGMSVNKALKRYHRERHDDKDRAPSKADEEKELWKNLRLKKNDRGEVVLFFAPPETS
jgi:cell growth-regulating nucleolar protein